MKGFLALVFKVLSNIPSLSTVLPCDSDPCQNGATCGNAGENYVCRCPEGFEGENCELNSCKSSS